MPTSGVLGQGDSPAVPGLGTGEEVEEDALGCPGGRPGPGED
jgi:hypothetical protein